MSVVSLKKLAWRFLFLSLFLGVTLVFGADRVFAYAYTQVWQDHFTTDPLGSQPDCSSQKNGGPGPTGWYWYWAKNSTDGAEGRKGCFTQRNGTEIDVYAESTMRNGPDLYREDLGTFAPSNWRMDVRFNFYEKHGYGVGFPITCQKKSTCAWLDKAQILAFAGLVGGSRNVFDIHVYDPSLGGMWIREWPADGHVNVWHTLRVEKYGTTLYLYLDGVLQHTSTGVDSRYRPSMMFFGDPTGNPVGPWTRVKSDYVGIYNVTACSVPGKPALSVSPSGCTNDNTPTWSWSASSGGCSIDNYEIERSWAANFTTTSTSYTPTLGTGSYWIRVRAHNSAGWGPWSDQVTVQADLSGPDTPTHSSPANNYCTNDNTPTLTSNATSDVGCGGGVEYRIQVRDSGGAVVATSSWSSNRSYTTPTLSSGTYTWEIRARDRFANYSAWSSGRTLRVDKDAPPTPDLVSPPDKSKTIDDTPTLTVNSVADVGCSGTVRYQIVVDEDSNFGSVEGDSGWQAGISYTVSPALAPATYPQIYYWRARSQDDLGNTSNWSAPWSFELFGSGAIEGRVWDDTGYDEGGDCFYNPSGRVYAGPQIRVEYGCEGLDPASCCSENYDPAKDVCWTNTSTVSGAEGRYRFDIVPAGVYTVSIDGYVPDGWYPTTLLNCLGISVAQDGVGYAYFGVSRNPHSWIQGINGDIYGNGITVSVPSQEAWDGSDTYTADGDTYYRWFLDANPGHTATYPGGGVVISGNATLTCGGDGVPGRCSRRPSGGSTEPGWHVTGETIGWPSSDWGRLSISTQPISWGALDPNTVYYTEADYTVPDYYNLKSDGVAVLYFKNANITFQAPGFTCDPPTCNSDTKGVVFLVEGGNVTIPGGVHEIDALILVDGGQITIGATNVANNLVVQGMLYAENGISFNRTIDIDQNDDGNRIPAVKVEYHPLYLYSNPLAEQRVFWREVTP